MKRIIAATKKRWRLQKAQAAKVQPSARKKAPVKKTVVTAAKKSAPSKKVAVKKTAPSSAQAAMETAAQ